MSFLNHPSLLRRTLLADAMTCAVMGIILAGALGPVATMTGLPQALTLWVGIALLPIAGYNAFIGSRAETPIWAVWLLILGNAGWVIASVALLLVLDSLTPIGIAFVAVQAVGVLILTELEIIGVRRLSRQSGIAAA